MQKEKYKAMICGHTGATGKVVLDELVEAEWISSIVTIGRSNYLKYANHPKVKQIIIEDMTDLSSIKADDLGNIDLAFDLVATSVADAFKGEETYRRVDVEMTSEFAKLAKSVGAAFLSAIGMEDMRGYEYASKAKKDFEDYAKSLNFEHLAFMHPKWVNRETNSKWYEKFYTLFGLIGTRASHMGRCIVWAAKHQKESEKEYGAKEIKQIGSN